MRALENAHWVQRPPQSCGRNRRQSLGRAGTSPQPLPSGALARRRVTTPSRFAAWK